MTYFVPLGVGVRLSTPLFSPVVLAYLIACGIVLVSVGNLAMLGLMSRDLVARERQPAA
jgi:hypothetical protein